jgi:hypothetical protein
MSAGGRLDLAGVRFPERERYADTTGP